MQSDLAKFKPCKYSFKREIVLIGLIANIDPSIGMFRPIVQYRTKIGFKERFLLRFSERGFICERDERFRKDYITQVYSATR